MRMNKKYSMCILLSLRERNKIERIAQGKSMIVGRMRKIRNEGLSREM